MSNKKKILITIDWFLPGTLSGGPVRSYANLIEYLKEDFEFYIITRNTDYGSTEAYKDITPNTWVFFNESTKIYYISEPRLNRAHLKTIISHLEFDIAFINGIYSWYFSILPIFILNKEHKPIIISARGMLNSQAFSVKRKKKKIYLAIARLLGIYKGVKFHATNLDEAKCIKAEIGLNASVQVAPNLPRKLSNQHTDKKNKSNPTRFVNIARIAVEKGTLTLLSALKDIKEPMELDLYGPIYDSVYWDNCKTVISELPNYIKVTYKGVLESEEVPLTLTEYDFFALLSEGENFGHAILEAFSAGLPVLISNKTPWKNLENQHLGWDINLKNRTEILNALNVAISMKSEDYFKWSESAYQHAKTFIENPELIEQNKTLFLNT
ncbi:glycosyltransferase [Winogradskyella costae]|uniref:glycosyltransferase n=1 Tax=Winogradskyella costae TaxID=2697008 RepID=UPI0015CDE7F7|nr:glycosyltransferase [Winogradskyella costae]